MKRISTALFGLMTACLSVAAQDYTPLQLLKNLNTDIQPGVVNVPTYQAGDKAYFFYVNYYSTHGLQLGVTDGTPAGTRIIKEIYADLPTNVTPMGSKIFFQTGSQLWITDGTVEGTEILMTGLISQLTAMAVIPQTQLLIFQVRTPQGTTQMWKSDGTQAGTSLFLFNSNQQFGSVGTGMGKYYYYSGTGGVDYELWRTDGTAEGTQLVKDLTLSSSSSAPRSFVASNDKIYFVAYPANTSVSDELYVSDGTSAGTTKLVSYVNFTHNISPKAIVNNQLLFLKGTSGELSLFKTDGTVNGTVMVKNFTGNGNVPLSFVSTSTSLFFLRDATGAREVWSSDGTDTGTKKIGDLSYSAGFGPTDLSGARVLGNNLYFIGYPNETTSILWKSDGNTMTKVTEVNDVNRIYNVVAAGVNLAFIRRDTGVNGNIWGSTTAGVMQKLLEFPPIPGDTNGGAESVVFNGFLYVPIGPNSELWKTNGTTVFEKVAGAPAGVGYFLVADNRMYFLGDDGTHGKQLWYYDGTNAVMMTNFTAGAEGEVGNQFLFPWHNRVFFNTFSSTSSRLWLTNATGTGATEITGVEGFPFAIMNEKIYLQAYDNDDKAQVWVIDGTSGGTQLLVDLNFQIASGYNYRINYTKILNNKLFFSVDYAPFGRPTTEHRHQLWVSDGTSGGTIEIRSEGFAHASYQVFPYNNKIYFGAFDETHNVSIWRTDGTLTGTEFFFDPSPGNMVTGNLGAFSIINDKFFFWWYNISDVTFTSDEIWSFDAATAPTKLKTFKHYDAYYNELMFNGKLYFTADDGTGNGSELWVTDATVEGTKFVRDTYPGSGSAFIDTMIGGFNDSFYFRTTTDKGRQLWKSDGTTCRTRIVTSPSIQINRIYKYNDQSIILNARTEDTGMEFFAYNRSAEAPSLCRLEQNIVFYDITIPYSDTPVSLTSINFGVASSGLPVTFSMSNNTTISVSDGKITTLKPGKVQVTITQPGDNTYEPAPAVVALVTISKQKQQIQFSALSNKIYGDAPFQLAATSNSSNPITYTSSDPTTVSISGNIATIVKVGTVTITATQAGDANKLDANPVSQSLTVVKANQAINFTSIDHIVADGTTMRLMATSSSGLVVTFSTTSTNAILTTDLISATSGGKVKVKASQSGNENYNAATDVEKEFCANPVAPTLAYDEGSQNITGNATGVYEWFRNGTSVTGATATYHATESGNYTANVSIDGCKSANSAVLPVAITGLEDELTLSVYPLPVTDYLHLRLNSTDTPTFTWISSDGKKLSINNKIESGNDGRVVKFDLSEVPAGVYILKVNQVAKKIIKR